eukprot:TRINITY_DN3834_c0_g1_i1.p1 TRINITY_DN3834_c0_g1~~TRINITY_DN3834_c0_g1_i1.p1  ORF type:complete len:306 (-),score=108.99 TRINITY_DN3834_c0_g1_i1:46-834(-)
MERNVLTYRSYIAQGNYKIVLDEIKDDKGIPQLQAIKLLARYFTESDKEAIVQSVKDLMKDGVVANDSTVQIIAATIYYNEGLYEEALRCVFNNSNSLEALATLIQIYLKINRIDLAEKELRTLQKLEDDATITLLATCWVQLAQGGEKVSEALSTVQDMIEKYGATMTLLNIQAVAALSLGKKDVAEKAILSALEKNPNQADTLANQIGIYQQLSKQPELLGRITAQLQNVAPKNYSWLADAARAERDFDAAAAKYAPEAR